jgi:poly(3-hydroxybutyrate) depolymerase
VSADPGLLYAAGFSNSAGLVWQLLNSELVSRFRGFAAVGVALDPEKAERYRRQLPSGTDPPPVPVMYVHGTADHTFRPPATLQEVPIGTTHPAHTVREMLTRNGIPLDAPATTTTLVPGSANLTEVVVQHFTGGLAAFSVATVINGGHNWPGPTTVGNPPVAAHFDATQAMLDFWHTNAGLP